MNQFFGLVGYEGNEFMKASDKLREHVDVVHDVYYKEEGELVKKLEKSENVRRIYEYTILLDDKL